MDIAEPISEKAAAGRSGTHRAITPRILYFGTPVVLLSTLNEDGSPNLAPISSAWALDRTVVLGLGANGQSAANLSVRPELVINLPSAGQWRSVEALAPLTGRDPVPAAKRPVFRTERDKFAAAGLTPQPSQVVRPPRVAECPLQLEARTVRIRGGAAGGFLIAEAEVVRVHAEAGLVVPGTQHIDPGRWNPLIYNFRHYFGLGEQLGHSFRSQTPAAGGPADVAEGAGA
ncbi:flavin reductase family protein [Streptomyces sp. HPF1205]|uniref:flavin reductase family protein n=1 Tax=Streptomyces sp. HPF1205 TaxID=2873262 RepID=UPI001CEDF1F0|nr:flavin reductase family protein [Streptomyces sp. HPF1205]